jgi:hypothetical protein
MEVTNSVSVMAVSMPLTEEFRNWSKKLRAAASSGTISDG